MRLFKLLVIGIIIGSIYLYAKHHSADPNDLALPGKWHTISMGHGISVRFPGQPVSTSFKKQIPSLGKINLTTYQSARDEDIFIVLLTPAATSALKGKAINTIEDIIHVLNDTADLLIIDKRYFMLHAQPGVEYMAKTQAGTKLWCRTVKRDTQLISIIYANRSAAYNEKLRDAFLNSLQL